MQGGTVGGGIGAGGGKDGGEAEQKGWGGGVRMEGVG